MKKILIVIGLIAVAGLFAYAGEPVGLTQGMDSRYLDAHEAVTFSSITIASDAALPIKQYRKIILDNLNASTSVFYRLDGSSASISTVGLVARPNTRTEIESSNIIYYQLSAGVSSASVRKLTRIK